MTQRFTWLLALLAWGTVVAGAGCESRPPSNSGGATTTSAVAATSIALRTFAGKSTIVSITDTTLICAMATWCPYSRAFRDFLKDQRIAPRIRNWRLVFVYIDEWETVERKLRETGLSGSALEERLAAFKARAGFGPVFDRNFTSQSPGESFLLPPLSGFKVSGYPGVLNVERKEFHGVPLSELFGQCTRSEAESIGAIYKEYVDRE